jgi:hypothetical protein
MAMLPLRRFLLAVLLTGLVLGCQEKPKPAPSGAETPAEHMAKKIKKVQDQPEGPPAPPLRK